VYFSEPFPTTPLRPHSGSPLKVPYRSRMLTSIRWRIFWGLKLFFRGGGQFFFFFVQGSLFQSVVRIRVDAFAKVSTCISPLLLRDAELRSRFCETPQEHHQDREKTRIAMSFGTRQFTFSVIATRILEGHSFLVTLRDVAVGDWSN